MEYYAGVLFLTTNRVDTFDSAVQSRIHLALGYGQLAPESRAQIWNQCIRSQLKEVPAWLDIVSLQKLASEELNGRQIMNLVKTAIHLAKSGHRNLSIEHIERTLDFIRSFNRDFERLDTGTKKRTQDSVFSLTEESREIKRRRLELPTANEISSKQGFISGILRSMAAKCTKLMSTLAGRY